MQRTNLVHRYSKKRPPLAKKTTIQAQNASPAVIVNNVLAVHPTLYGSDSVLVTVTKRPIKSLE